MTAPLPASNPSPNADRTLRDRELDAWLERAFGLHRADPEPVLHDLE